MANLGKTNKSPHLRAFAGVIVSLFGALLCLMPLNAQTVDSTEPLTYRESIKSVMPMATTGLDPDLANILSSYYTYNFGSSANWQKLQSIRFDGMLHLTEGSVRFIAFKKKPDYSKVVLFLPSGGRLVLAHDGIDAWQLNTALPDAKAESMLPSQARNFIRDATTGGHLLYPVLESKKIRLVGTAMVDGHRCYELEITLPDGERIRSVLDMGTLHERSQKTLNAVTELEEINTHHDFREINGVRFPTKSTMKSGGEVIHRVEMLNIQVNLGVMPWMFKRSSGAYVPGSKVNDSSNKSPEKRPAPSFSAFDPDPLSVVSQESAFEDLESEELKSILDDLGKPLQH